MWGGSGDHQIPKVLIPSSSPDEEGYGEGDEEGSEPLDVAAQEFLHCWGRQGGAQGGHGEESHEGADVADVSYEFFDVPHAGEFVEVRADGYADGRRHHQHVKRK